MKPEKFFENVTDMKKLAVVTDKSNVTAFVRFCGWKHTMLCTNKNKNNVFQMEHSNYCNVKRNSEQDVSIRWNSIPICFLEYHKKRTSNINALVNKL